MSNNPFDPNYKSQIPVKKPQRRAKPSESIKKQMDYVIPKFVPDDKKVKHDR